MQTVDCVLLPKLCHPKNRNTDVQNGLNASVHFWIELPFNIVRFALQERTDNMYNPFLHEYSC